MDRPKAIGLEILGGAALGAAGGYLGGLAGAASGGVPRRGRFFRVAGLLADGIRADLVTVRF